MAVLEQNVANGFGKMWKSDKMSKKNEIENGNKNNILTRKCRKSLQQVPFRTVPHRSAPFRTVPHY